MDRETERLVPHTLQHTIWCPQWRCFRPHFQRLMIAYAYIFSIISQSDDNIYNSCFVKCAHSHSVKALFTILILPERWSYKRKQQCYPDLSTKEDKRKETARQDMNKSRRMSFIYQETSMNDAYTLTLKIEK